MANKFKENYFKKQKEVIIIKSSLFIIIKYSLPIIDFRNTIIIYIYYHLFKANFFSKTITSEEIEKEFWRLLSSPNESVIVEYGADLHTLETGSGFPTYSNKGKLNQNDKVKILFYDNS
jgi:hypothetical protein